MGTAPQRQITYICFDTFLKLLLSNRYIASLMAGLSVTIFAYGATGSGKTFTMMGAGSTGLSQVSGANKKKKDKSKSKSSNKTGIQDGLTQMMLKDLCKAVSKQRAAGDDVKLKIS